MISCTVGPDIKCKPDIYKYTCAHTHLWKVNSWKCIYPCMWENTKPTAHGSSRLEQQGPDGGVTQFEVSLRQLVIASVLFFCEQLGVEMRSRTRARSTIWHLAHQISQLQPGLSLTLYPSLLSRSTLLRVISSSQGLHQICSWYIIPRKGEPGPVSWIFLLFLKLPVILIRLQYFPQGLCSTPGSF